MYVVELLTTNKRYVYSTINKSAAYHKANAIADGDHVIYCKIWNAKQTKVIDRA